MDYLEKGSKRILGTWGNFKITETLYLIGFGCDILHETSGSFSLIGPIFQADFGEKVFNLNYESLDTLVVTEAKGPTVGRRQVLAVSVVELRPKVFMVNWQEANKLTVTDIEDYERGIVYANLTTPSLNFAHLKGTLRKIK